jgi:hypothetical protein
MYLMTSSIMHFHVLTCSPPPLSQPTLFHKTDLIVRFHNYFHILTWFKRHIIYLIYLSTNECNNELGIQLINLFCYPLSVIYVLGFEAIINITTWTWYNFAGYTFSDLTIFD